MVIDNFHIIGTIFAPHKAHSPLVVHANAVLPFAIAGQGFEPIAGRRSQVPQFPGGSHLIQLAPRYRLDVDPARYPFALVQGLGIAAFE